MRIQHNILAMNAYRNYTNNTSALGKNLEKLSSGYKINRAGDDAAGLAISEKMRAQITGLDAAQKNVKDGISLVKTAEGAMQEVQDMLNRMVYLATQSANGTYDNEVDRDNLQKEVDQLRSEIDRISDSTNFNGIKLLDGSLDEGKVTTRTAASALSGITTSEYSPKGVSDAFEVSCLATRPAAAASQTCAVFEVSLDDVDIKDFEAGDVFKLKIGNTEITVSFTAGETIGTIISNLINKGGSGLSDSTPTVTTGTTQMNATTANDHDGFLADSGWGQTEGSYVDIDGHIWLMEAGSTTGKSIKFTQVDWMTTAGEEVNPDYEVTVSAVSGEDDNNGVDPSLTGKLNRRVQVTTSGIAKGSSEQARVDVTIDFSKLKDGDTFTAGNKNYIFAIGKNSQYKDKTTVSDAGATFNVINLSSIFKADSDLLDSDKQARAMTTIVNAMKGTDGTAETWSAGNQGVSDNIGTITFQSLSTYTDDTKDSPNLGANNCIGGVVANGICDMTEEVSIYKQFYSGRQESGAKLSFNLDVTKIKAGDTFTLDGKTFEFTDGETPSSKNNIAIDLSTLGITGGILNSQTAQVMDKIQKAIEGNLKLPGTGDNKYAVTIDGNKMTLSSNEDLTTPTFEGRIAATMRLPTVTSTGKALTLQIGDTSDNYNQLSVSIGDIHCNALKIDGVDISSQEGASSAVDIIKNAINTVSSIRGTLGATQNRLEHTQNNLSVMAENIQDAESTIRDTDVAEEMMSYVKNNILVQSAQAMLAQANQVPQGVLQLLG